jgi:hypothetical protein
MSIAHNCEKCGKSDPDECYCTRCLEEIKQESYKEGEDDGYYNGYKDGQEAERSNTAA